MKDFIDKIFTVTLILIITTIIVFHNNKILEMANLNKKLKS